MENVMAILGASDRPLSTNEVAEELDVDWHTANDRLETMVEKGEAHRSQVSSRLTLYWDREIPF